MSGANFLSLSMDSRQVWRGQCGRRLEGEDEGGSGLLGPYEEMRQWFGSDSTLAYTESTHVHCNRWQAMDSLGTGLLISRYYSK